MRKQLNLILSLSQTQLLNQNKQSPVLWEKRKQLKQIKKQLKQIKKQLKQNKKQLKQMKKRLKENCW